MAQQTAVKRQSTLTDGGSKPAPKPRVKGPKTFDYTKYRQSIRDEGDFARYLADYPDKSGILLYVYRLEPKIDMGLINVTENSILKTADVAQMNRDFLASKFGRGVYLLKLNDANRPKGQTEAVRTWVTVDDPDLDSIYDPRTLKLGAPENQDEIARLMQRGILVRDASGNPKLKTQADGEVAQSSVSHSNGAGGASSELLSRDVLGQVLLKLVNAGSQSPNESVRNAIEMARMLQPAQPAGAGLSVEQIAELVAARLERTITKTNSEGDFIQTYERVEAFMQKVRGPAAPPIVAGDGVAGWAAAAPQMLAQLATIVPQVIQGLKELQQMRQPVNHRRPTGPPQQQQQPGAQQPTVADRIAFIATLGFEKMEQGVTGFDFAAYICNYHPGGLEIYRMLEPGSTAGVMGLAAMNPATAPYLTNPEKRAQVEAFLDDFFSFNPDGDSVSGVEDAPPAFDGDSTTA